jgi:hypothetical protein
LISPNLVIEEIIKSQYYSFMAVASKVALVHDATLKAKELLEQYQAKHGTGNVFRGSTSANKESFSQMASLLTPSFQNSNTQQTGMLNKGSLLGTSTFGAKPAGTSLFGNTTATNTGGTGLFGSNTATPGTGLFGNTTTTTSNTGMFGNANTATTPGTGMFGNTATTANTGTGLFGNTSNTNASSGLFGSAKRSNSAGA